MKRRSSPPDVAAEFAPEVSRTARVTIEAMGGQGHGVAQIGGRKAYIPFALPAEIVRVEISGAKGDLIAVEAPSPDRVPPLCKHFGICGGCSLQHWRESAYADWKAGLVKAALAREGLSAPLAALKTYPLASRRRAAFTARKDGGGMRLGFNAARSHETVDLEECPILSPQIVSALPRLKVALAGALPNGAEAKVWLTAAQNGLDCSIEAPKLTATAVARLTQALPAAGIIRAAWNGDIIFLETAPSVLAGGVKVALPQGAFLQAVEACERDMAAFVCEALDEARAAKGPVCDLFAGLGAFTFPCAKKAAVTAFEDNAAAVEALTKAAKAASGIKPVKAVRRDLFRNPVGSVELNAFSAAIADPPREGAEAQSRALAASKIRTVVMLSCNPVTFARDAAILTAGGFTLSRIAVFDQFKFSPHVEIAGAFDRAGSKKGRLAPALKR